MGAENKGFKKSLNVSELRNYTITGFATELEEAVL
jgi:hypothetical protein